jgi:hypothetical protein
MERTRSLNFFFRSRVPKGVSGALTLMGAISQTEDVMTELTASKPVVRETGVGDRGER